MAWNEKMKQLWERVQVDRAKKLKKFHLTPLQMRKLIAKRKGKNK